MLERPTDQFRERVLPYVIALLVVSAIGWSIINIVDLFGPDLWNGSGFVGMGWIAVLFLLAPLFDPIRSAVRRRTTRRRY
jgi:uncharacterized membrane protein YcjF (UPF0283 family)